MSRAAELSGTIEVCLGEISPSAGYHTEVRGVYGVGKVKPDKAGLPCIVVHLAEDEGSDRVGPTVKRVATYQIEAVFPRTATLQDMQLAHHDILRSLGYGQNLPDRPLKPGWIGEEAAEFDLAEDGGGHRRAIATISIQYVEQY